MDSSRHRYTKEIEKDGETKRERDKYECIHQDIDK
jgi:hypothetical protein